MGSSWRIQIPAPPKLSGGRVWCSYRKEGHQAIFIFVRKIWRRETHRTAGSIELLTVSQSPTLIPSSSLLLPLDKLDLSPLSFLLVWNGSEITPFTNTRLYLILAFPLPDCKSMTANSPFLPRNTEKYKIRIISLGLTKCCQTLRDNP